jgi:hypothetical protein
MLKNVSPRQVQWLMLVILVTQRQRSGGLQFEISQLGQKSLQDPISTGKCVVAHTSYLSYVGSIGRRTVV